MNVKRVLLSDDSRVARMTLKKVIEGFGNIVVYEAKDGLEYLELI
jgi:CheY-like chemotaxis protein